MRQALLCELLVIEVELEREVQNILILDRVHQDYLILVAIERKRRLRKVLQTEAFVFYDRKALCDPGFQFG